MQWRHWCRCLSMCWHQCNPRHVQLRFKGICSVLLTSPDGRTAAFVCLFVCLFVCSTCYNDSVAISCKIRIIALPSDECDGLCTLICVMSIITPSLVKPTRWRIAAISTKTRFHYNTRTLQHTHISTHTHFALTGFPTPRVLCSAQ
jgi:hypothetical protein